MGQKQPNGENNYEITFLFLYQIRKREN